MPRQKPNHATRKLTAAEKAKYARMRSKIEQEFPPGQAVKLRPDASEPPTLGDFFDLRAVLRELRKARESQGLSLSDIQNVTGIDRSAISRLENNENSNPTINTLIRYARAVGRRIEITLTKHNR